MRHSAKYGTMFSAWGTVPLCLTLLSCLTKTAMEDSQSKKRGGWCNAYVDGLVEKCKAEAKLAVPLK